MENAGVKRIQGVGQTFSNVSDALRRTIESAERRYGRQPVGTLSRTASIFYTDDSRCPSFSFFVFKYRAVDAVG